MIILNALGCVAYSAENEAEYWRGVEEYGMVSCGPGQYSLNGECATCPANKFVSGTGIRSECIPCPAGTVSSSDDRTYCITRGGSCFNPTGPEYVVQCVDNTFSDGKTPCTTTGNNPSCMSCPGSSTISGIIYSGSLGSSNDFAYCITPGGWCFNQAGPPYVVYCIKDTFAAQGTLCNGAGISASCSPCTGGGTSPPGSIECQISGGGA